MTKSVTLSVKEGKIREAVNGFLKDLFAKKIIDVILVPLAHPAGTNVVQALVTNPAYLDKADVFAPVMPVNSARLVQSLTRLSPVNRKTAVVIRPCEMRAFVELVKLKQIQLNNLLLIGIDCPGAYAVTDYSKFATGKTSDEFVKDGFKWAEDKILRAGCQICEYPYPLTADITIGMLGLNPSQQILVQAESAKGEETLTKLGMNLAPDGEPAQKRNAAIVKFAAEIKDRRKQFFEKTKKEVGGGENLNKIFANCIKCQNFRQACPVCYCRECFFVSPTFELESERYLSQADKKGALRMPADTTLFHLTRMNHMGNSCVGCGACEEACPNDIPLLKIFQLIGSETQELFGYVPGRNVDEPLPATAFKEKEFERIGEK